MLANNSVCGLIWNAIISAVSERVTLHNFILRTRMFAGYTLLIFLSCGIPNKYVRHHNQCFLLISLRRQLLAWFRQEFRNASHPLLLLRFGIAYNACVVLPCFVILAPVFLAVFYALFEFFFGDVSPIAFGMSCVFYTVVLVKVPESLALMAVRVAFARWLLLFVRNNSYLNFCSHFVRLYTCLSVA